MATVKIADGPHPAGSKAGVDSQKRDPGHSIHQLRPLPNHGNAHSDDDVVNIRSISRVSTRRASVHAEDDEPDLLRTSDFRHAQVPSPVELYQNIMY